MRGGSNDRKNLSSASLFGLVRASGCGVDAMAQMTKSTISKNGT